MASIGGKVVLAASNFARNLGQSLDKLGSNMEVLKFSERLVPSTRFVAVNGIAPSVSESAAFIAPTANVIGNVTIGKNSSVWYGATVRGDVNQIIIGDNTSIGDRAIIHVAKIQGDFPTIIGDNVTISAGSMVHAATVNDHSVVGASAQVLDGSVIESNSIVAPGSVVTPGTRIPSGEMWAGSPAKMVRKLTSEEMASIATFAQDTARFAMEHAIECSKDYKQVVADEEAMQDRLERDPEYFQPRDVDQADVQGMGEPGRIFNSILTRPEEGLQMNKKNENK